MFMISITQIDIFSTICQHLFMDIPQKFHNWRRKSTNQWTKREERKVSLKDVLQDFAAVVSPKNDAFKRKIMCVCCKTVWFKKYYCAS